MGNIICPPDSNDKPLNQPPSQQDLTRAQITGPVSPSSVNLQIGNDQLVRPLPSTPQIKGKPWRIDYSLNTWKLTSICFISALRSTNVDMGGCLSNDKDIKTKRALPSQEELGGSGSQIVNPNNVNVHIDQNRPLPLTPPHKGISYRRNLAILSAFSFALNIVSLSFVFLLIFMWHFAILLLMYTGKHNWELEGQDKMSIRR